MNLPQRVLVVDDDPIQRAVLQQIFTKHGSVAVETAADGIHAIAIVEGSVEAFDLIVLDLQMPQYDGIEFMAYLESQIVEARILLISGLPQKFVRMSTTLAEAGGLRTIGFLNKPIRLEELLAMVGGQAWRGNKPAKSGSDEAMRVGLG